MANVFLYAPQSFHNICLLSRSLECFGQTDCYLFDPHHLVREHYGKYRRRELRVVSRGAFETIRWIRIEDPQEFFAHLPNRLVATVADPLAVPLTSFQFNPTDIILFGSESGGLPSEVIATSGACVTIPSQGQILSLNLAVAASVLLFEYQRQMATRASVGETHSDHCRA
jgi:tRNA G18 (ribose-2'-O)-methylase SpoU